MINLQYLENNVLLSQIVFLKRKNDVVVFKYDNHFLKSLIPLEVAPDATHFTTISHENYEKLLDKLSCIDITYPELIKSNIDGFGIGQIKFSQNLIINETKLNIFYQEDNQYNVNCETPRLTQLVKTIRDFENILNYQLINLFDMKEKLKTKMAYETEKKSQTNKFSL